MVIVGMNTQDVSLFEASLTAAGINHFITSELIKYIYRPDSYNGPIGHYTPKIVSEYDQEIPQSQTVDNPVAPRRRAAQPSRDTRKTN